MSDQQTFVLKFLNDCRECYLDGEYFVHVLCKSFRMRKDDPRIIEIKPVAKPLH